MDDHKADRSGQPAPAVISLHIRRKQLVAIVVLALVTWFAILLSMFPAASRGAKYLRTLYDTALHGRHFECNPGPWGSLQYSVISLEMSEVYAELFHCRELPEWFFPGFGEEDMARLAREAGLPPTQMAGFLEKSRWTPEEGGILVRPDRDLVLSLSPEAREKIYAVLESSQRNDWHKSPLVRRAELADYWLSTKNFSPHVVSLIKRLSYRRGDAIVFTDVELLLSSIADPTEKKDVLLRLFCRPTMFLKLRLDSETDIDEVCAYWQHESNSAYLKALLRSAAQTEGGQSVDVVHLLPSLPRMLLYSSLPPGTSEAGDRRDCFWTSANFFNVAADDSLADTGKFIRTVNSDYRAVPLERRLGDLILFVGKDQRPVHACNYIADDIVFTKNGRGSGMPWMFADLRDVVALYAAFQSLDVRTFRRAEKPVSPGK